MLKTLRSKSSKGEGNILKDFHLVEAEAEQEEAREKRSAESMKVEEDTILRAIEESVIKPSAEETDQKPPPAGENSQINNSSNILLLSSIMSLDGSIKNFLMANGTTPVVAGKASNEVARTGQKPLGTSTS